MKTILLIIGLFCCVSNYAECSWGGISVFPRGNKINQNSIFIIDGYGESQKVIINLNKKNNIYLKSGNKKIKLIVTKINVGQYHLTQAILKPQTQLEVGREYTIFIDNLAQYENLDRYNKKTQKNEPITYKVTSTKDNQKPKLFTRPKELTKTFKLYGCGDSTHVIFNNPAKDSSEIIIKTTVKNLKTNKETTYYIEPSENKIEIGHDMCSGAFVFESKGNYEVEFSFMDSSGNVTSWTGKRIQFTSPESKIF